MPRPLGAWDARRMDYATDLELLSESTNLVVVRTRGGFIREWWSKGIGSESGSGFLDPQTQRISKTIARNWRTTCVRLFASRRRPGLECRLPCHPFRPNVRQCRN